jgi:hypothetical protein
MRLTVLWLLGLALAAAPSFAAPAGDPSASAANSKQPSQRANANPAEQLSQGQQRVSDQFRHLEEVMLRMSELSVSTDPNRAALLKKAVGQSKDQLIVPRLNRLVELLKKDQLAPALENQADLDRDLQTLLQLLLTENREKRLGQERTRIREYLKRLGRLIQQEKDIQGRTAGGDDTPRLSSEQGQLAEKTGDLSKDVKKNEEGQNANEKERRKANSDNRGGKDSEKEQGKQRPDGKPSEGGGKPEKSTDGGKEQGNQEPPSAARQRLEMARQRMKEAEAKLKQAERKGAGEKQEQAIRELEQAKTQLEEILRQLREEEIQRALVMLEARFRRMLAMQQEVYEGTMRLDKVPQAERTHNHEIESSRLSGKESQILVDVDNAAMLLRDDGTAAAMAEAVQQIREDVQQVVPRLAQSKVGKLTQDLEKDVITALQEMIETLKKAQKDQEKKNKNQPRPQPGGPPQEPPLVEMLAELKMIRTLQMRVNTRTAQYAKLIEGEQAQEGELVKALKSLAEREQRIQTITRNLQMGKNQ